MAGSQVAARVPGLQIQPNTGGGVAQGVSKGMAQLNSFIETAVPAHFKKKEEDTQEAVQAAIVAGAQTEQEVLQKLPKHLSGFASYAPDVIDDRLGRADGLRAATAVQARIASNPEKYSDMNTVIAEFETLKGNYAQANAARPGRVASFGTSFAPHEARMQTTAAHAHGEAKRTEVEEAFATEFEELVLATLAAGGGYEDLVAAAPALSMSSAMGDAVGKKGAFGSQKTLYNKLADLAGREELIHDIGPLLEGLRDSQYFTDPAIDAGITKLINTAANRSETAFEVDTKARADARDEAFRSWKLKALGQALKNQGKVDDDVMKEAAQFPAAHIYLNQLKEYGAQGTFGQQEVSDDKMQSARTAIQLDGPLEDAQDAMEEIMLYGSTGQRKEIVNLYNQERVKPDPQKQAGRSTIAHKFPTNGINPNADGFLPAGAVGKEVVKYGRANMEANRVYEEQLAMGVAPQNALNAAIAAGNDMIKGIEADTKLNNEAKAKADTAAREAEAGFTAARKVVIDGLLVNLADDFPDMQARIAEGKRILRLAREPGRTNRFFPDPSPSDLHPALAGLDREVDLLRKTYQQSLP